MKKKRLKRFYKVVWANCPKCQKVIQRVGVFRRKFGLVGYLGINCSFCKTFQKADEGKIDFIQGLKKTKY